MSKIEWCDETINPLGWGCYGPGGTPENPKPCDYCYAKRFAARNTRGCDLCRQFIPHWHPEQLEKVSRWRKPRKVFIQSMGDLFGDWVPNRWIDAVIEVAYDNRQHIFQFLTKNPKRLKETNFPPNCWVGTTVTNQADADERLPWLLKVDAPVRFISHEPLLGPINIYVRPVKDCHWADADDGCCTHPDMVNPECFIGTPCSISVFQRGFYDWAIIGAQTGPGAIKPKPEWVQGLIDQYRAAGVPLWLKDNLKWPEKIQEFPCTPPSP